MKYAILGSRDYPKLARVSELVRSLPSDSIIVTGGAHGVDEAAERAARAFGFRLIVAPVVTAGLDSFHDDHQRRVEFGKRAYARTTWIVENSDEVVEFVAYCGRPNCTRPAARHWTHGAAHGIAEALRLGKPLTVFGPAGTLVPA